MVFLAGKKANKALCETGDFSIIFGSLSACKKPS
jgi:hypothetical protein